MTRALWTTLAKVAVTGLLLTLLVRQVDRESLLPLLARLDLGHFVLAITMHMTAFLLTGLRWWRLLVVQLPDARFASVLPSYLMGVFANNVLPTTVGGDAARTLHLHMLRLPLDALVSSAFVDRLLGVVSVFLMGGLALTLFPHDEAARTLGLGVLAALVLGIIVTSVAVSKRAGTLLARVEKRFGERRFIGFVLRAIGQCQRYGQTPGLIIALTLLTLVSQSIIVLLYALLAQGLGVAIDVGALFYVIPTVLMAANIPISVGGLGVREGALVGLLALFGVPASEAVGLSIVYLLVLWITTLPGAVAMLFLRRAQASA